MTKIIKYIRVLISKVMQKQNHKDEKPKQPEKDVRREKESGGTEGQPSTNPNERTTVTKRG